MSNDLQTQIDDIKSRLDSLNNSIGFSDTRYKQILADLDNTHLLLETGLSWDSPLGQIINSDIANIVCLNYINPTKVYRYTINRPINIIYVTMIGGGGAGGIGHLDGYYYSGGGGGAGACFFRKPFPIVKGCVLNITVGMGGDISKNEHGQPSYIEIIYPDGNNKTLSVEGGKNGKSDNTLNTDVSGGHGGKSEFVSIYDGNKGENGQQGLPSFASVYGGKGGSSMLSHGGKGGTEDNLIGIDGIFGGGGGGSVPRILTNMKGKLSGNGGSGLIIIEF